MIYLHNPKKFNKTVKRIFTEDFLSTLNEQTDGEDVVINWGSLSESTLEDYLILNDPACVVKASNKLTTLAMLEANNIPALLQTQSVVAAKQWIVEGHVVFGRKLLAGSKGKGITLLTEPHQVDGTYKMFTRNFPKTHEYRIFATPSRVIDHVQRKRRYGVTVDGKIRTHANGWVFCHENINKYPVLEKAAMKTVKVLGLDFAAVDMLAVLHKDESRTLKNYRVCEVNTAPGIENTETIAKFQEYFADVLSN